MQQSLPNYCENELTQAKFNDSRSFTFYLVTRGCVWTRSTAAWERLSAVLHQPWLKYPPKSAVIFQKRTAAAAVWTSIVEGWDCRCPVMQERTDFALQIRATIATYMQVKMCGAIKASRHGILPWTCTAGVILAWSRDAMTRSQVCRIVIA